MAQTITYYVKSNQKALLLFAAVFNENIAKNEQCCLYGTLEVPVHYFSQMTYRPMGYSTRVWPTFTTVDSSHSVMRLRTRVTILIIRY